VLKPNGILSLLADEIEGNHNMSTLHKIIIGDSRHIREVQLKDYGDENKTFVNAHLIKNGLADVNVAKD
jgi:hypothetical protein